MNRQRAKALWRARELTGQGLQQIAHGMRAAGTDDPLLGACYAAAEGLAVNIYGDRHAWNLEHARQLAARLTEKR